jgi:hypothetical protein
MGEEEWALRSHAKRTHLSARQGPMAKVFGCPGAGRQKYKQSVYTALQLFLSYFSFSHLTKLIYWLLGGGIWKYMTAEGTNKNTSTTTTTFTSPQDFLRHVLAIDTSIRFAGLADSKGTKAHHMYREGLKPLLSPEETDKSMLQAVIRNGMRSTLEDKIGECVYVLGVYKKVKRVTIPLHPPVVKERGILMVSLDLDSDHDTVLAGKVLPFIEKARLDFS